MVVCFHFRVLYFRILLKTTLLQSRCVIELSSMRMVVVVHETRMDRFCVNYSGSTIAEPGGDVLQKGKFFNCLRNRQSKG
jgi:hypothetical protein